MEKRNIMVAKVCSVCNVNKVGMFNSTAIIDGKICNSCLTKIGLKDTNFSNDVILQRLSANDIQIMIDNEEKIDYKSKLAEIKSEKKELAQASKDAYQDILNSFKEKGLVKYHGLYFDGEDKRILAPKSLTQDYQLLSYDDLISFTPVVREGQINKHHGLARAAVGGAVFGVGGAIVGAATGHKNFAAVSKMAVDLNFKNGFTKSVTFINTTTKTDSLTFKMADKEFSTYCAFLERIVNSQENQVSESDNSVDDIRKIKALLDEGIITQEDFDAKKKQILGI